MATLTAEVLKRDRAMIAFGLVGIAILSWTYLIRMNWEMRHMDVGMQMFIMPAMEHWTAWDLVLVFLMWAVMMVPAASPTILLFAEINRRRHEHQGTLVATGQFLLGYLTARTGFGVVATLAQWGLLAATLVSPMMESTSNARAGLLLMAGLFQFSRLKYACLAHCRSPLGFLATEWREGSWGAFRMGLKHGIYCLGCCWALMGLLFAFGVVNLLWIAGLSILVLTEKIAPSSDWSAASPVSFLSVGQHGLFLRRLYDDPGALDMSKFRKESILGLYGRGAATQKNGLPCQTRKTTYQPQPLDPLARKNGRTNTC